MSARRTGDEMTDPEHLAKAAIPITWDGNLPPEVKAAIAPLLAKHSALLPPWLEDLSVRYDASRSDRMAAEINYHNRCATLIVTGEWLADHEREETFLHEVAHIVIEPFYAAVQRIVDDTLNPDGNKSPAYGLAQSVATDALEATVEDIARAFGRMRAP